MRGCVAVAVSKPERVLRATGHRPQASETGSGRPSPVARPSSPKPFAIFRHPNTVTTRALTLAAMSGPVPAGAPAHVPVELARIRAAQAGDTDAFRAVYEAHVGRVRALCLRLSGDTVRADELTQDVFVRVWERLGTFRGESAFGTWLHRLAVNEVLQTLRSAGRRERRVAIMSEPPDAPIHGGAGPEASMDLEHAIAGLPEGCRTVFVLHDVEGLRHDEIASLTGTAVGTSKAHLFRARRLLRQALDR